jgi:hypothetical protein
MTPTICRLPLFQFRLEQASAVNSLAMTTVGGRERGFLARRDEGHREAEIKAGRRAHANMNGASASKYSLRPGERVLHTTRFVAILTHFAAS